MGKSPFALFFTIKMKKILILPLLIALAAVTACQHKDMLRENALTYIQAMADYRIDDAYPYATLETQKNTLDYFKHIMYIVDSSYIKSNTPAKITLDSIVPTSDTSATVYFHKKTPIQPRVEATVDMRLRDGNWLAHQVVLPAPMLGGSALTKSKEASDDRRNPNLDSLAKLGR